MLPGRGFGEGSASFDVKQHGVGVMIDASFSSPSLDGTSPSLAFSQASWLIVSGKFCKCQIECKTEGFKQLAKYQALQ